MAQQKRSWLASLGGLLKRNSTQTGDTNWLVSKLLAFQATKSGQSVTADRALQSTAALACVRVIAEDTAMTPFVVKRRDGKGQPWRVDEDHWLTVLMRRPNDWMTGYEFRQMLTAHAALCGDGFAFINPAPGKPQRFELLPFPPHCVTPEWARDAEGKIGWEVQYRVTWKDGSYSTIPRASMFRLRGLVWDALLATEPFRLAREAIGIALAAEESHAKLHANGVRLSGILTTASDVAALSEASAKRIEAQWKENFGSGAPQEFGVAVLEGGMKFEPMSMSGVDAQHLETRAFQVAEIARAMRVHPGMIGHFDKGSTFASAEQMVLAHDTHTISPWCARWSDAVEKYFLRPSNEPHVWASFDQRGLRRGDAKARAAYYNSGIHAGWLSRNEARELEGFETRPGLDEFLAPVQLAPGNSADAANERDGQNSSPAGAAE